MPYSLLIIDMQSRFAASNKKSTQEHCKRAIKKAIADKASIIFVEYIGYGPTMPSLVKLTDNYHKTFIVRKPSDDGSRQVRKIIKNNRLPMRNIKLCGVNTDCCVLATIYGLYSKLKKSKMQVLAKACNSYCNHPLGLKRMEEIGVSVKR